MVVVTGSSKAVEAKSADRFFADDFYFGFEERII
jgi:hypothetical protein